MTSTQLQSYLRQVISSEIEYQTSERAFRACSSKIKTLAIPRKFTAPARPDRKKVEAPEVGPIIVGVIVFSVVVALCFGVVYLAESYQGDSLLLMVVFTLLNAMSGLILLAGLALGAYLAYWFGRAEYESNLKWNSEVDEMESNYREAYFRYKKDTAEEEARMAKETAMVPILRKDIALLDERRKKSRETLERFYALDVIKPKYRNLLCAATFLDYLENERCYSLTGHEGCYNLFEEEKQRGIIISQLTNISSQLTQIRKNQELVADALERIEQNTRYLCEGIAENGKKVDMLVQDQRTAAYYAEQAANDQRALKDYIMMRDWLNA